MSESKINKKNKSKQKITTIIFDLNKTLVNFHIEKSVDKKYLANFRVDRSTFWHASREFQKSYGIGKMHMDEFFKKILKKLHLDKKLLPKAKQIHEESFYVIKGMREILKKLKKKYKILLLAGDGYESVDFKIDDFGLRKYFDEIYSTCKEGMIKTDIRLYKRMIKKSQLNPKECLFIDDLQEHVNVARECGINTILFKNATQLEKDLKKFNVLM